MSIEDPARLQRALDRVTQGHAVAFRSGNGSSPGSEALLTAEEMAVAVKFLIWVKRSLELSPDHTDRKLAEFVLKEVGA